MTNRRLFIKQVTAAGAGAFLPATLYALNPYSGKPSRKVIVGVIGVNGRGLYLAQSFAKLADVEVGYLCDVDEMVLAKSIAEMEKLTGKKPQGFRDLRQMLGVKDIDAVVIATPDHWHTPAAILACQAGKHVYVEKPCSHNPAEGEMLIQAAQKYKRLVQMGNQRRSYPNLIQAMQELKEGAIGRVYAAKGWFTSNRTSIGVGKVVPVPTHLDYELWQGPAPRMPYRDNLIHYNWHWFWNWGTGEALNNGTHELDVMRWGLGVEFPTKVVSAGGRYHLKDDWQTPDTQTISLEFADQKMMMWEGRSCNNYPVEGSGRGVIFFGDNGSMVIPGGNDYKIFDPKNKLVREIKSNFAIDATNTVSVSAVLDRFHFENFLNAVRDGQALNAPIREGHISTLLPQLGNIAYRTGSVLTCNPQTGHILNNPQAEALWGRSYQKGWEVTV